jgi:hypothetical protein
MENQIVSTLKTKLKSFEKALSKHLAEMNLTGPLTINILLHNVPMDRMPESANRLEDSLGATKHYWLHFFGGDVSLASEWKEVELLEIENEEGLLDDYNQDIYLANS